MPFHIFKQGTNSRNPRFFKAVSVLSVVIVLIFFRIFCGIFVIQPLGMLPKGVTIVYWRHGTDLPFIASADGVLIEKNIPVSPLSRAMLLAGVIGEIKKEEIVKLDYSEALYEWSTDGKRFN